MEVQHAHVSFLRGHGRACSLPSITAGGLPYLLVRYIDIQGKSSLVRRLCDKPFREEYVPTLGFDIAVVPFGTYQVLPCFTACMIDANFQAMCAQNARRILLSKAKSSWDLTGLTLTVQPHIRYIDFSCKEARACAPPLSPPPSRHSAFPFVRMSYDRNGPTPTRRLDRLYPRLSRDLGATREPSSLGRGGITAECATLPPRSHRRRGRRCGVRDGRYE